MSKAQAVRLRVYRQAVLPNTLKKRRKIQRIMKIASWVYGCTLLFICFLTGSMIDCESLLPLGAFTASLLLLIWHGYVNKSFKECDWYVR